MFDWSKPQLLTFTMFQLRDMAPPELVPIHESASGQLVTLTHHKSHSPHMEIRQVIYSLFKSLTVYSEYSYCAQHPGVPVLSPRVKYDLD